MNLAWKNNLVKLVSIEYYISNHSKGLMISILPPLPPQVRNYPNQYCEISHFSHTESYKVCDDILA